jgi:predicted Zn-dependent protease
MLETSSPELHMPASVAFYTAQSYLALNQPAEALPILTEWANQEGTYQAAFKWYTALVYLKLENTQQAIPYLNELSSSPNMYQQPAQELLTELN